VRSFWATCHAVSSNCRFVQFDGCVDTCTFALVLILFCAGLVCSCLERLLTTLCFVLCFLGIWPRALFGSCLVAESRLTLHPDSVLDFAQPFKKYVNNVAAILAGVGNVAQVWFFGCTASDCSRIWCAVVLAALDRTDSSSPRFVRLCAVKTFRQHFCFSVWCAGHAVPGVLEGERHRPLDLFLRRDGALPARE
jgi:hypothetical protein